MKIGQVAEKSGVTVATVRYYERLGLVPEAPRNPSGYRRFGDRTVRRLQFIQRAQALGFSLREIGELLDLRADVEAKAGDVARRVADKLEDIEAKIADLEEMRDSLRGLARRCRGEGPANRCSILEALDGDPEAPLVEEA